MIEPSAPTLDQRRAKHAWDAVQRAKGSGDFEAFERHAKQLPVRILTSGLGHALAFLNAKGYAPALLRALGDWILDKRQNPQSTRDAPEPAAILEEIVKGDATFLRRATEEALAYLTWLTRFAEGLAKDDDEADPR